MPMIVAKTGSGGIVIQDWIFFGLIVATIFGYRRRDAVDASRSPSTYRAPGYPLLPALFVITAAFVVASAIWSNPRNAMLGVFLIAAGIPAFLFWRRRSSLPVSPSAP
jgi:APA family basic amino acid/polyamine antiporter